MTTNKLLKQLQTLTGEDTLPTALLLISIIDKRHKNLKFDEAKQELWKGDRQEVLNLVYKIFDSVQVREKLSRRGGGVEISLSSFGFGGHKMLAYQNYLGGDMLGSIQSSDTVRHVGDTQSEVMYSSKVWELDLIAEALQRYFSHLMGNDESYEVTQTMPSAAY